MNLKIRLMRKRDLSQLAKIYSKAYKKIKVGEIWTEKTSKKLFEYWAKKQPDLFFVAEINKTVVGAFVTGIKPWWDGNHLFDGEIFVDTNYQNLGIGTKLMQAVFKKASKKYNAITFEATTFNNKKFPRNWYKKIGISKDKELVFISGNIKIALKKLEKN